MENNVNILRKIFTDELDREDHDYSHAEVYLALLEIFVLLGVKIRLDYEESIDSIVKKFREGFELIIEELVDYEENCQDLLNNRKKND